jgi:phospholipid/cholesterol/gamma-HCH transport system substrate-binding protein
MSGRFQTQVKGIIGYLVVALVVWFLIATYQKKFVDVVHVQVTADRAGLLLDPGADVRAFGLKVGEVRGARLDGDGVIIDIAVDKSEADSIPSGVSVSIGATTVFGSKYVELQVPTGAVPDPISSGETIQASSTTVEVNDVFQSTMDLLTAVDPAEINRALTSVATALDGNGQRLGEVIADGDSYLKALNPSIDTLSDDFVRAESVVGTYADVIPSLLRTTDNLSTTSDTLSSRRAELHRLLTSASAASENAGTFLDLTEPTLVAMLRSVEPFSGLLYMYGPQLPCTVDLLVQHAQVVDLFYSKKLNSIQGYAGFLPSQKPYDFQNNAPKLVTGVGPKCYRLATEDRPYLPHVNFDDGTADIYTKERNSTGTSTGLAGAIFGTTGLDQLLNLTVPEKGDTP